MKLKSIRYTRRWSPPYRVEIFVNYFTRIRQPVLPRLFVARLRHRYCPPCCATSCKSQACKTRKTHELGHFFFFFFFRHQRRERCSSREAGGKSLIHLGRSESGVNPCENNAEGWIMMIVETTYRSVVRVFPRWICGWAVFSDVLHIQAWPHNRTALSFQFSLGCTRARIDKLVLFHPYSRWGLRSSAFVPNGAYFTAKLLLFGNRSLYNDDKDEIRALKI